jgi:hypothetical protein
MEDARTRSKRKKKVNEDCDPKDKENVKRKIKN